MKHSNLFGKTLSALTASAMLLIGNTAFSGSNTLTAKAADQQTRGNIGGYDYEMWNQNGQGNAQMNPSAGSFTCSWSNIENFLARMGKNYDSKKQSYKQIGSNIVLTYDVEYTPRGNSYMCVYGWTRNPLMEYYIVEGWGDWRPPGDGAERKGNVTLNGNTYDIAKTMRYNQPSLDGTATFPQYWSIRQTSGSRNNTQNNMSGQIDVSKHFDAWSKAGLDMSGTLYEVSLNIEGYRSNGSANVKSVRVYENFEDHGENQDNVEDDTTTAVEPDENGYYFNDGFEGSDNSWSGRASETVESSSAAALSGSSSLSVSGRNNTWNGAAKSLSSSTFKAGTEYSFSANVMYESGPSEQTFQLSLQYSDGSTTKYDHIASGTATKGEWLQLANTKYEIPAGASNVVLYVETDENDSNYIDFYLDDVIGAKAGTEIKGAEPPKKAVMGDVNFDGVIDSLDMIAARKGLLAGDFKGSALKAADVDQNGAFETADLVLIQSYILRKIAEWPEPEIIIPPAPTIDTSKWDSYQETASSQYIDFYKSSIKHFGNTYRLDSKLAAAENGESLTIAYLGGSITEGKNYTSPFSSYVKSTFAKGSFKEINAGLSGTSSVVGLVRSEQEIVSQKADIIFLEFSVNDHEDIMYKKCFESCIKKFLDMPNEPAVIVLITRAQGGFSSQSQMYPIGKNFDIPVISMDDALTKAFNSGFLKTGDYYSDEYHPHQKGGQLIADCLAYYFRQAMKSENLSASYELPTKAVYGMEYADCVNVNPKDLTNFNAGSWSAGSGYNGSKSLNYSYTLNGGSPMTFKTTGKGLIIVFKANSNGMGSINVTVNGKTTKVNGNKQYTWGGPDAELGYYQDTTGELDVSISGSGSFTIWGMGLIK
jgi:hypothetical protein